MDARSLLQFQLEDAGFQLDQVLSDFPADSFGKKAGAISMTPKEIVGHLCETYVATVKHLEGEKHQWGSFTAPGDDELMNEFRRLRAEAVDSVLKHGPDGFRVAHMYIVAHDYYHVGQLCAARSECDPTWDHYSIYR